MNSSGTTTPATTSAMAATPVISPASTPATSDQQQENNDVPHSPKQPMTKDFHLDTFFSPVWMTGPNVFSFNENGNVVRPQTHKPEPYPGYYADGVRIRAAKTQPQPEPASESSAHTSSSHGFVRKKDPKPWKNVAITEQDEEEFAEMQAKALARAHAIGEQEERMRVQREMQMYAGHCYPDQQHPMVPGGGQMYCGHPQPMGPVGSRMYYGQVQPHAQRTVQGYEQQDLLYSSQPPPPGHRYWQGR